MICFMVNVEHMTCLSWPRMACRIFMQMGAPQFASANGLDDSHVGQRRKSGLLTGRDKELLQKVLQPT